MRSSTKLSKKQIIFINVFINSVIYVENSIIEKSQFEDRSVYCGKLPYPIPDDLMVGEERKRRESRKNEEELIQDHLLEYEQRRQSMEKHKKSRQRLICQSSVSSEMDNELKVSESIELKKEQPSNLQKQGSGLNGKMMNGLKELCTGKLCLWTLQMKTRSEYSY